MKWAAKASITLVTMLGILGASDSQAGEFGLAGGLFSPWIGDPGWNFSAQILDSDPGGRLRWGGELEYRDYRSNFTLEGGALPADQTVKDIDVKDVLVNALLHYRLFPEGWTPYVGLGLGLGVNIIDKNAIEEQVELFRSFKINKVGFLLGTLAVIGLEAPIGTHFSWYTEARGNIYARISGDGDATFRNSSGWDFRTGFRLLY